MRSSKFKIFFLFLLSFEFSNSSDFSIGSHCILNSGASGTCQEWENCAIIKDLWAKRAITRAHVTVCNKFQRTICCPNSLDDETTTKRTIEPEEATTEGRIRTPRPRPTRPVATEPTTTHSAVQRHRERDNLNEERISQIKCKEYGKKVWQITIITPLIGHEPKTINNSRCTHKSVSLIVGGTEANVDEFPHQALLGYSPRNRDVKWLCGGSLVSPNFVLTAAHCLFDRSQGQVKKVKVGMRNRDQEHDDRKVFVYNIAERYEHPNYNADTFDEDIALLKLDGTVPINEHILPVCLPTTQHDDFKALATGFGRTQSKGQQSEVLMKVTLEKFTHDECKEAYPEDGITQINEKTMLCYGHHKERKDICRGDSGGPLQISNENNVHCTYTQIGISSFGPDRCGTAGFPSGFTNVYNYVDWIESIVWG